MVRFRIGEGGGGGGGRGNDVEKQGILGEGGKGCCCYFL